jgi:thiol-disulfide isomerase/thioredoxin
MTHKIRLCAVLLSLLAACQPADTYEARYEKCFENVEITTFDVEGSTAKGLSYSGFDTRCLVGARLPDFQATTIAGAAISTSRLKGKVTLINFWFIKCAPCIAEMPYLNALVDKYGKEKVNFLAFSRDAAPDIVKSLKKNPFHFEQIADAAPIIKERFRSIWGYPSTIVANQEGRIVAIFLGAKLESDPSVDVATAVDALLEELLGD